MLYRDEICWSLKLSVDWLREVVSCFCNVGIVDANVVNNNCINDNSNNDANITLSDTDICNSLSQDSYIGSNNGMVMI